jgi:dephospho-CoA kinase
MSTWKGKYVIGVTGNIATGKSVVRKMLEHLGAYGIDADALSHRTIANGAPGFDKVVEEFGHWIVGDDGEIDRDKLGNLVFSDLAALEKLEEIVHPYVRQAIDHLVKKSKHKVVAIEAIKLLESPLRDACDAVWVTSTSESVQLQRLIDRSEMDLAATKQRIAAQSPQSEKVAAADIVIKNNGTFEETWQQVKHAWLQTFPKDTQDASGPIPVAKKTTGSLQELTVLRARPRQAEQIATFINRLSEGSRNLSSFDVMAGFGEKAYLLLTVNDDLAGLVGWKVENLVARTDEIYLDDSLKLEDAVSFLITEVEKASKELQCEASLVFVTPEIARQVDVWTMLGYESRDISSLDVSAWQAAAQESQVAGTVMLFKQLRVDRVLKPI